MCFNFFGGLSKLLLRYNVSVSSNTLIVGKRILPFCSLKQLNK